MLRSLNLFQPLFLYLFYVLVLECVFPALILIPVVCFGPWMCFSSPYSDTCSMFWSLNVFQLLFWYLFYVLVLECVPALIFTLVLFLCSGLWIYSNPFFLHLIWGESSTVVPHLTISVFGSSCNYVFFCLILAPLFLFSFLGNPN